MPSDSAPINLTNHFLIAMPAMADPHFARSLTFICEHNDRGALGIVSAQKPPAYLDPNPELFQWGNVPYNETAKGFGFKAHQKATDALKAAAAAGLSVKAEVVSSFANKPELTLAAGTVPENGQFVTTLAVPDNARRGDVFHLQALTQQDGQTLWSRGLSYRVQVEPPSGQRKTVSLAVTPDGRRAFVADALSGVVTLVDAVNDQKLLDLPVTLPAGTVPQASRRTADEGKVVVGLQVVEQVPEETGIQRFACCTGQQFTQPR